MTVILWQYLTTMHIDVGNIFLTILWQCLNLCLICSQCCDNVWITAYNIVKILWKNVLNVQVIHCQNSVTIFVHILKYCKISWKDCGKTKNGNIFLILSKCCDNIGTFSKTLQQHCAHISSKYCHKRTYQWWGQYFVFAG